MKPKYLFRLIIYGILLFIVGCSTSDQVGQVSTNDPDSTPQAELTPPPAPATLTPEVELSPVLADKEIQIRLINMSELDFDHVSVNFLGQEVDYGELASGQQSSYESVQEAYRYASVKVEANGETYEMRPIDYIGETPLTAGQYSYALDIIGEQVQIAYLPDDEAIVDLDLVGSDWYWVSAQKADNSNLFPMSHGEHPSIRFTQDSDANVSGLYFEGYASCNWMGGAYHVNQYHTLVTHDIDMTQQGCSYSRSDLETFFLHVLRGINYYSVEGDYLFLFSWADGMMTFTRHDPASEPPYATDS